MNKPLKLTVLAAALAAGCSSVSPVANQRLEEARASYQRAAADPLVQRHAQPELQRAANALAEAGRAAKDGSSELVEQNAYIADRSARTALSTAQGRQAQLDLVAAHEERSRRLLQAERARAEQAEKARQEAEARATQLADAKAKQDRETAAAEELAAEVRRLESAGVRARQTERGWVLTANDDLLFESGTTLRAGAERTLDTLAQFLRKHPERSIAIEGFTDGTGSVQAAERLSARRAEAVKFALVQRGVEPQRIDARGMGPNFPVASNDSEAGRQQNRRIEVVIRSAGAAGDKAGAGATAPEAPKKQ
jgi:outer membrane protein OmpA-like peptidoglycan-associated protein